MEIFLYVFYFFEIGCMWFEVGMEGIVGNQDLGNVDVVLFEDFLLDDFDLVDDVQVVENVVYLLEEVGFGVDVYDCFVGFGDLSFVRGMVSCQDCLSKLGEFLMGG